MLKKKKRGAAMVETVFVLPLFILLVFLVLEFQQLGQVRHAISSIATMMAQDFSISGSARSFQKCINKFHGIIDPTKVSYYIHLYKDLNDITQHEAYYDTNGNGVYDSNEPYADMNFSKDFNFEQGTADIIFVGKQDANKDFFKQDPNIKAGLVVVLYKFRFILDMIQSIFSFVSLRNDKHKSLPIIGTGIIVRNPK